MFVCIKVVSGYSWDEQMEICETYNFSLAECSQFWDIVANLSLNNTVYVNQTIYQNVTGNCTNDLSELDKIDEYQARGYEPVFENGIIVNFKKAETLTNCSVEGLTQEQCNQQKESERLARLSSELDDEGKDKDKINYFWIVVVLVFLGVLGFIGDKKGWFKPPYKPFSPSDTPHFRKPRSVPESVAKPEEKEDESKLNW